MPGNDARCCKATRTDQMQFLFDVVGVNQQFSITLLGTHQTTIHPFVELQC